MKICSCCKELKESNCFYKQNSAEDGLDPRCIPCSKKSKKETYKKTKEKAQLRTDRWKNSNKQNVSKHNKRYDIKKRFGLTLEEYDLISLRFWTEQNGCCAICGFEATSYGKATAKDKNTLHLDHCHKTGKIRGLLCMKCNSALGYFGDSSDTLYKAYIYLNK